MRTIFLAFIAAAAFSSSCAAEDWAIAPQGVICKSRNKTNSQIEIDAQVMAQIIRDGQTNARNVYNTHIEIMKKQDNFSDTKPEPFTSHHQMFVSAIFCADPADVKAYQNPKDANNITFHFDFWKTDINTLYDQVKSQISLMKPSTFAAFNKTANQAINSDDREQALAQFNANANYDNLKFRLSLNAQGELEIRAI